mgnify:CR=1 FL=1|tara:strand:+ start:9329 stop:10201 length:873 start_codon:yes stop_codon:yes gene_type:complete
MIVVTGATGELGRHTISFLLKKLPAQQIIGVGRTAGKAEGLKESEIMVRIADYSNYDSLVKGFKGADKIMMVSSPDPISRVEHHKNVINAAKETGVKFIVYTAMQQHADRKTKLMYSTEPDNETIEYIKESGIDYCIIKNPSYIDAIPFFLGANVLEKGVQMPGGQGKASYADREDLGEASATILLESNQYKNKEITLTGEISYSYNDIANILSEITGKPISYTNISPEQYIKNRIADGVPDFLADFLAKWIDGIKNNVFEEVYPDLERILGRKPHSLKEFLKSTYLTKI